MSDPKTLDGTDFDTKNGVPEDDRGDPATDYPDDDAVDQKEGTDQDGSTTDVP